MAPNRELTLKEKVELIKFIENNSERKAAIAFGVSKSCVHNIKKRSLEYLERIKTENSNMCRKVRKTKNDHVNKATLYWLEKMKTVNICITGPLIQKTALHIAKVLQVSDFQASSGWLESFKKRYLNNKTAFCSELLNKTSSDPGSVKLEDDSATINSELTDNEAVDMLDKLKCFAIKHNLTELLTHVGNAENSLYDFIVSKFVCT